MLYLYQKKEKMRTVLVILSALLLVSCAEKVEEVVINDQYSVEIPESMEETTGLNGDASLQYQNPGKELYIIVIDETKKSFGEAVEMYGEQSGVTENTFRSYADFILEDYKTAFPTEEEPSKKETEINGLEAEVYTYYTTFNSLNIVMKLALVDGAEHYYQLMTWTLKKYEDDHMPKMDAMINSFKEK